MFFMRGGRLPVLYSNYKLRGNRSSSGTAMAIAEGGLIAGLLSFGATFLEQMC